MGYDERIVGETQYFCATNVTPGAEECGVGDARMDKVFRQHGRTAESGVGYEVPRPTPDACTHKWEKNKFAHGGSSETCKALTVNGAKCCYRPYPRNTCSLCGSYDDSSYTGDIGNIRHAESGVGTFQTKAGGFSYYAGLLTIVLVCGFLGYYVGQRRNSDKKFVYEELNNDHKIELANFQQENRSMKKNDFFLKVFFG